TAGRLAELRDDDLRALVREQLGGDAAHPAARARDDRELVLKPHAPPPSLHPAVSALRMVRALPLGEEAALDDLGGGRECLALAGRGRSEESGQSDDPALASREQDPPALVGPRQAART